MARARAVGPPDRTVNTARVLNTAVGVWFFVSVFLWRHTNAEITNSYIVGVLCISFAGVAGYETIVWPINGALSVWVFASAFVLPRLSPLTVLNNVGAAVLIFGASLAALGHPARPREAGPPTRSG